MNEIVVAALETTTSALWMRNAGLGIAWRSTWEVEHEIRTGVLLSVLDEFAAPPNGIFALFPHAKHMPLRVRLWIDFLKQTYGDASYWSAAATPR